MSATHKEDKLPIRILVIEDDDTLAMLLMRALHRDGCFITHARDGEEGLRSFTREQPHVVLSDGLMPKMNGFEVCKAIRAQAGERVGLILMSAAFRTLSLRTKEVQEAQVDAFLSKPFVLGDLRKRVLELARRSIDVRRAAAGEAPVTHQERTRTGPVMLALETGQIEGPQAVAHTLLSLARGGATGLLRLEWEGSVLELALLRGVLVGARDNLREHQLGERLLRQGRITHDQLKQVNERIAAGERVAEALVSMGLCDAFEALQIIEQQVRERLVRALGWDHGSLRFLPDEPGVQRLAVEAYDLQAEVLRFALEHSSTALADQFLEARSAELLSRTVDFEDGLAQYAALRPSSTLPNALMAGELSVAAAIAEAPDSARDLFALWLAGLVRLTEDPPGVERPLPRPARAQETGLVVDKRAATKLAAVLLRCRGRNHYEALGVARDAPASELAAQLAGLEREVGIEALSDVQLGSARGAARELWAQLEAIRTDLLDEAARELYDRSLEPPAPKRPTPVAMAPEQAFLDGQLQLGLGSPQAAREAFERAVAGRPNDPDFNAWLAWSMILAGDDEAFALDVLETAARAFPQAMRPVFFLGLAAQRRGETSLAHSHLAEAARRSPVDIEVKAALVALGGAS